MKINTIRLVFVLGGLVANSALLPTVAQAANFSVNSDADAVDASAGDGICATAAGACTLRAAVQEANSLAGADTIALPSGTYYLSGASGEDAAAEGDLDVLDDLSIIGSGQTQTVIDATNGSTVDRIFQVILGVNLSLSKMTLQAGGVLTDGGAILHSGQTLSLSEVKFNANTSDHGGAVYSDGTEVVVDNCLFTDNAATSGGGIYGAAGSVAISNSTFQINQASVAGGGIYHTGTLSLTNVTLDNNTSSLDGGAIYSYSGAVLTGDRVYIKGNSIANNNGHGAGIYADTNTTLSLSVAGVANNTVSQGANSQGGGLYLLGSSSYLENVTVSSNEADVGGGIYAKNGVVTMQNSTLAYNANDNINLDATAGTNMRNSIIYSPASGSNCAGPGNFSSLGYNISDDTVCNLVATADQPSTDPQLASLDATNLTHALTGASNPAQDSGDNFSCPEVDGAYNSRSDGACDIGAREADAVAVQPGTLGFTIDTAMVNETAGTMTLNVSRTNGSDLSVTVNFSTQDGSAVGGTDYIPGNGTLTWEHGDTTDKTITIGLIDDTAVEGEETFTVSLTNPGGSAQLGSITTTTVSIISDDSEAPPPPAEEPPPTEEPPPPDDDDSQICTPGSHHNNGTDRCTDGRPRGGRAAIDPIFLLVGFIGYLLWFRRLSISKT